ncbi:hypothetical protein BJX66DRAFT_342262 [Aspergillus keveii]|uniref:Uncharacterized protein n=1 Tax=Aspergillus keveii TaxID=714993 RepID=A0ABR4FSS9_9EURO
MKLAAIFALALATLTVAAPAPAPLEKRSCKSDCSSLASRYCTSSCLGNGSCFAACYPTNYNTCVKNYC